MTPVELRALARKARSRSGKWYPGLKDATGREYIEISASTAQFIAACSPDAILTLLDELEKVHTERTAYYRRATKAEALLRAAHSSVPDKALWEAIRSYLGYGRNDHD
jgi:5'-deoxynucleotidase YfbR-like HD superfamily hydrolase